jgi:tRNA(Ile)-lysidine synthase
MLDKLRQHITDQFPFLEGKKLLIAISGGLDSVVLARLFHSLHHAISLAHCNFNLRGLESDKDAEFVNEIGKELGLKTYTTRFNTDAYASKNKISTQIAARELRYQWFQELIVAHEFDYVLTAHHADDNLETFLINLTRGTGLEGFTGIPAVNNTIVRPLLIFSREEIEQFAKENSIAWREDQSNAATKYIRNKIRHQIIPVLKEINPALVHSFQKTTANLKGSQQIINDAISQVRKRVLVVDKAGLTKFDLSEIQKSSNLKAYLFELLKEYGFTEWNDIEHLVTAQSGKQVFSKTHRLVKDRAFLLLTELPSQKEVLLEEVAVLIQKETKEIVVPIHITFENVPEVQPVHKNTIFIDVDKVSFPLQLRKWKAGDYFYPTGMQGKKKLSKFFKDEKYSLIDKENTWLLCSENEIIWIVGKREDRRFVANKASLTIVKAYITQ